MSTISVGACSAVWSRDGQPDVEITNQNLPVDNRFVWQTGGKTDDVTETLSVTFTAQTTNTDHNALSAPQKYALRQC